MVRKEKINSKMAVTNAIVFVAEALIMIASDYLVDKDMNSFSSLAIT